MALDLKAFIKEFSPTDEEIATLEGFFGKPERLSVLEKNQLRQQDYSKHMNDLAQAQAKVEAAQTRLNAEAAEWASLSAAEKEANTKLRDSIEKSQAKILTLTQRVERIATDAGLDPAKALEGIDQTPPPKKDDPPEFDTSKFVGADQFGSMSEYLFNLTTELPLIAQEHFDLTGERLDTRALRAEITKRAKDKNANLDPRAIWEDTYKIPEKRDTKTKAEREAELKSAEQRGFDRARSEAALPVPPSHGVRSPLLRGTDGKARESILKRQQPESGIAAAAQRLSKLRDMPPIGSATK